MKRIVSICICFCMIFAALFSLTSCNDLDYKNAIKLLDEGKYEEFYQKYRFKLAERVSD